MLEFFLLSLAVEYLECGFSLLERHTRLQPREQIEPGVSFIGQRVPGWSDSELHHHRDPHLSRQTGVRPLKARRRHTHHREGLAVETNGGSGNILLPAKPVLPEVVLQHRHRVVFRHQVVRRRQDTAPPGPHAQNLKEIAGHQAN